MSLSTFIKLCAKAFRFSVSRPAQHFNIYNRVKKHLGPDAKYFMPAPRAIGQMSANLGKPIQYPHLQDGKGFKSIRTRRMQALAKDSSGGANASQSILPPLSPRQDTIDPQAFMPKSFSRTKQDDQLVIESVNKLEVTKSVVKIELNDGRDRKLIAQGDIREADAKPSRPLPKCTNLDLSDPASIWVVNKTPPGKLNLDMLQELMVNKLSDNLYWTPKVVAERYNIKEEYAESLMNYVKQIRIVVSPRMATALDVVGKNNAMYQATKQVIYHVDKSLRTKKDKMYDDMFLPTDRLDPEVRNIIDAPALVERSSSKNELDKPRQIVKRPAPLRIAPLNQPQSSESSHTISKLKTLQQMPLLNDIAPKDSESKT